MAIFGSFLKHRVRRTGQKRSIFGVNLNAPKIMSDATKTKKKLTKKRNKKFQIWPLLTGLERQSGQK